MIPDSLVASAPFLLAVVLGAAETMSRKITKMNHGQGFAANFATGILVILASVVGLPVSTTHVAVGSLFGVGLTTGQANPKVMTSIAMSWLLTLPCAALVGAFAYRLLAASLLHV